MQTQTKAKRARRRPWIEAGMSYFDWCVERARKNAPSRQWHPLDTATLWTETPAKPDLCALVETVQGGSKVIWLSEGFPVDRSRYGRITLERRQKGASE